MNFERVCEFNFQISAGVTIVGFSLAENVSINTYSVKQSDLYYLEGAEMTS